jgi:anti-sigma regulatory factor (Ser/Thr protein kinase)
MRTTQLAPLTRWITEAALQHPADLPRYLARCLGIGQKRAESVAAELAAAQWLEVDDTQSPRQWRPGPLRQVVKRYRLKGLMEDLPWRRDFAPCFTLPAAVHAMAQHGFTELLNNAIDHSGGSTVSVSMRQTPLHFQLLVSDNGCGLFERLAKRFDLSDPHLALLELCKGKLTSAPELHTGYGLFYTAQLADVFAIHANGWAFQRHEWERVQWRTRRQSEQAPGTSLFMGLALDTQRQLDEVLRAQSADGKGYGFARTTVPLHLLANQGSLASRAEAKRALARLPLFSRAVIDFAGVQDISPCFADEMFRIFRRDHPETRLVPVGMTPQIMQMVQSLRL